MDLMGEFAAAGVTGAAGWRCWEHMGFEAIAPDGLVYLEHSPYGPGWHYLECERFARGATTGDKDTFVGTRPL